MWRKIISNNNQLTRNVLQGDNHYLAVGYVCLGGFITVSIFLTATTVYYRSVKVISCNYQSDEKIVILQEKVDQSENFEAQLREE